MAILIYLTATAAEDVNGPLYLQNSITTTAQFRSVSWNINLSKPGVRADLSLNPACYVLRFSKADAAAAC